MTALDLFEKPKRSWTPTPGGIRGAIAPPSAHDWTYLRIAANMQPRWPDMCACCLAMTNLHIDVLAGKPHKNARVYRVPLCVECEEHHEIPISRTGTNALEPVHLLLLCLSVAMMFLGVLTGKFLFFGLLIPLVVAIWWVTHLLAGTLHDWRRREGSHCIMSFTTRQEPVADHMLEVMDTSSISQAVIVFKIPREVVFGFGNEKYAAAFKQLNSAVPYTGDLPSAAWF